MRITSGQGGTDVQAPSPPATTRLIRCAIIPIVALSLFGFFALLWVIGPRSAYFQILDFMGIAPFRFAFVDTHAVLSAAACHRQAVDIFAHNPCDVLLRPFDQSPLWLSLVPPSLGVTDTPWVGLSLDFAFILSLAAVFHPRSMHEFIVVGLAVVSPTTLYLVERANPDILIFLLVLGGTLLGVQSRKQRFFSYALFLFAGLLKYYPLVLLVTLGRERWRTLVSPALLAAGGLLAFCLCYRGVLHEALGNIPAGSYFDGAFFWALNLPYGLAAIANAPSQVHAAIGLFFLSVLVAAVILQAWRQTSLLSVFGLDWQRREMRCLAAACLVMPFCFFAAPNNLYRGVFLLLAMPGLLHLWTVVDDAAVHRWLGRMICAVVFVLWAQFFQHALATAPAAGLFGTVVFLRAGFWLVREAVWWWLIAGLASFAVLCVRDFPLSQQLLPQLRWLCREPAR